MSDGVERPRTAEKHQPSHEGHPTNKNRRGTTVDTWKWLLVLWLTFDAAFVLGAWWASRRSEAERIREEWRAAAANGSLQRHLNAVRNLP